MKRSKRWISTGSEFVQTTKRSYPLGTFASYLIGFAQADDDGEVSGRMGIEQYMNAALSGRGGYKRYQADKNGNILPGMKMEEKSSREWQRRDFNAGSGDSGSVGNSVHADAAEFNPEKVWGSVMEVRNRQDPGMGPSPSFDPNTMDIDDYVNYVSQMPYEPGSTMKVFTYAAAIDSGAYDGSVLVDSSRFCYAATNRKPYRVSQGDSRKIGCIGNASGKSWG